MASRAAVLRNQCRFSHGRIRRSITDPSSRRYVSIQSQSARCQPHFNLAMLPGSPFWISLLESNIPKIQKEDSSSSKILACSSLTQQKRISRRIVEWLQRWWQRVWKAFLVATRTTEVFLRLSPLLIFMPAAYLSEDLSEMAWNYALHAIQGLGPVAVKFCQWMATRRDIFPSWCCDRFGVLHDQGTPHSWAHTDHVLSEAFGDDYYQKGLQLQPNDVIGCGSAAQVYRGTLTTADQPTRTVAVKVLHPHFKALVERDLQWMQIVAEFLHSLPSETLKMLNLPRAADNFGSILKLQADLTNEAENLQQFRSNFYHSSTKLEEQSSITFPRPIDGWNHNTKVLVEEYVHDAIPISNFLQDSTPEGLDIRRELAGPLLRAFLKMVFLDNFVHGDLHPGNVLVQESKQSDGVVKRSIVFVDAGIANSLSPTDQRNLRDLFRAVIFNDGHRAGRLMIERAKYERCSQVPGGVEAFANGVADIVSEFHDRRREGLTLGAVRIGSLLSRVLDLCRIHGVEIDPAMASVVISTLVLEGLGRSLSAELNLIDFAKPFLLGRGRV